MTYAEQVKAEVAARYGVPVLCEVTILPIRVENPAPSKMTRWAARHHNPVKPEEYQIMCRMWDEGKTVTEICLTLKRTSRTIMREMEGRLRPGALVPHTISDDEIALMRRMRGQGHSLRHIAKVTGRAPSAVLRKISCSMPASWAG